ncbi:hypothetical protein QQF64_031285 [Cirrhinus molitorella]|uniref:Gypsy retrotransposon integrase-like protein 1 n=1 Tax=Cirrhinus molitorella TaxID=172907 RepID=A0ABR3MWM3_9TELE
MGHLGIERTLDLIRSRFYWPRMAAIVEDQVKTCERCIRRKTPPERAAPLVNMETSRPLRMNRRIRSRVDPHPGLLMERTKEVMV